jgi:hypothetical protein
MAMIVLEAVVMLGGGPAVFGSAQQWPVAPVAPEPNAATASAWWPPLRNVWTPIGLKSHPFRFNVLYNGTIIANPHPLGEILGHPIKTYLARYAGLGVQLTFIPSLDGTCPPAPNHPYQLSSMLDGGVGLQGWEDRPAPVLWTRWPLTHKYGNTGVALRESVFAHTPKGATVRTGREPLYAWIHLSVEHVDPFDAPPTTFMMIHLGNAEMIQRSMFHEDNLMVYPERAVYPRALTREAFSIGTVSCCRLVEPDGKIRLIGMTRSGAIQLIERAPGSRDYFLQVSLPSAKGNTVDLLLPMIPGERDAVEAEASAGFDEALRESDRYWSERPKTAAVIDTPEPQVNEAFRRLAEMAQVIAETNPDTGERALLTGSWNYDTLWPTPACMSAHMLLDILGYHEFVAGHLEIFRSCQGTSKAPGNAYALHPGYFCAPRQLSSVDWLTDHGSILQAVAEHALLSGDQAFMDHWKEPILKACEFLRQNRTNTNHAGVPGVLPPAVATDANIPIQAVWNIAWNYKGLASAARLLRRTGHPQARFYEGEVRDFKEVFVKAYRQHARTMSRWTDASGTSHLVIPSTLSGPDHRSHPFFLDAGPLVLVYARLLDAQDELIQDSLAYYREGPNTLLYDPRGNMHQRAVLTREISSCEPCYSFNILCAWQAADRPRFLEGIYSLLAGSLSSQTFIGCEHRHGIYGLIAPGALMAYAMKLAVIDDALEENRLHLLRLAPLAWLRPDYETRFENLATEFGPVTLKFRLDSQTKALRVDWQPAFRLPPQSVILHVPPVDGLKVVVLNGKKIKAKPGAVVQVP